MLFFSVCEKQSVLKDKDDVRLSSFPDKAALLIVRRASRKHIGLLSQEKWMSRQSQLKEEMMRLRDSGKDQGKAKLGEIRKSEETPLISFAQRVGFQPQNE